MCLTKFPGASRISCGDRLEDRLMLRIGLFRGPGDVANRGALLDEETADHARDSMEHHIAGCLRNGRMEPDIQVTEPLSVNRVEALTPLLMQGTEELQIFFGGVEGRQFCRRALNLMPELEDVVQGARGIHRS